MLIRGQGVDLMIGGVSNSGCLEGELMRCVSNRGCIGRES